jgi:hypothetical protein
VKFTPFSDRRDGSRCAGDRVGDDAKALRLRGGGILLRSTSSRRRALIEGNAGVAVGSDGSSELGLGAINRRVHGRGRAIDQALRGLA